MQLTLTILNNFIFKITFSIRVFIHYFLIAYLLTGPSFGQEVVSNTLPVLSSIQSGNVNINSNNNVLNINQSSNKAIIDWKTFDVGSESTVNFNQPSASSSTLNKILSSDPSRIFGKLNSTGEVIFQNYGGIYFGKNSRLDVGSITATTGNIRNEDYLNDNYKFDLTNSTGNIENLGEINAFENYVALLSPEVRNSGLIVAEKTAVLGSGNEVTLNFINGGTLHSITTTESNVDTLVENKSAIEVPGGLIIISVKAKSSLVSSIINQEGILSTKQADQVVKKDGRVYLQASTINLSNNSEIIASGNDAGGLINLSATDISIKENSIIDTSGEIAGKIELNSTKGNLNLTNSTLRASSNENDGGKIILASTENIIIENSSIEARGLNNGGQILIGNDYLEKTIPIAKSTILDINTILNVSSFDTEQGIGGLIETSGLKLVTNASIQAGEGGSWIIDPFDIIIDDTTAGYINTALTAGTSVTLTTATETNDINNDPVNTITGSSGEGDITLNSAITSSGNGSLTLIAADDIYINAAISLSGTNNQVTLTAADIVYLGANVTTSGNQTINANVDIQGSSTLNSGLANITINGNVTASNGILAFLGDGDYLYNGTSYTVDGTEPIGILYDAASDTYKWQATVTTAEALIVAGGGGGGMDIGGGGGGGGVIAQDITLTPGWIDVKVGDGGAGAPSGGTGSGTQGRNSHQWTINAKQGENSSIVTANGTLTAIGGGYGGTGPWNHTLQGQAGSGGSGGGASGYNAGTSGRNGSGTAGQGNAGASGYNSHVGGGGGGAGGTGSTGRSNYASKGGDGIENCILGTCYYWAGGGGAAGHSYFGGHGGKGGGGGGGSYNSGGTVIAGGNGLNTGTVGGVGRNKPGGDGGVNTGGGGGGSTHYNATNKGGDGGSGIVVVKYQEALTLIGASINVTGNITDTSLTVTNTANSEIAGVVSGSTGLTKSGSGVLTMSGDSTYTGVTTISAGTLQTTGTLGNTDISISSGATYDVDATDTIGSIGGAGAINIATSQTLTTSTSSNTTVSGVISGAGTLEKAGTGTLTLSGSNDYTGGTSFAGGTVSLGSANAISTSGTLSFSGGAMQSTSSNTTDYSSRFNTGSSQAFKIDTNGQDITWASNLENTNSSITKTGTGTLTVSGNVGVTGDDSFVSPNINISAGTFVSSGTIHSIGTLTGGASTTLTLSSSPSITTLALSDGVTMTIPVLTVSGTSSIGGTITTQGNISLTGASTLAGNTTLTSNDNDVTFGSTINGEYTLTVAAGTGSASFGGTIGNSAAIKKLSVVASGGITLTGSISTVMGLNDGLYFQKFDGHYGNNVQNLSNRTEQVIKSTEVSGAPGNQKGIVADHIAICTGGNCDETYTYRVIGYFKPQQTGSHHFYSLADDPTHLYMGTSGQSIDEFVTQVESTSSYNKTGRVLSLTGCCSWVNGTVTLTAGNLYPMYHVFSENGGGDYSYLRWKNPDGAWVALQNSDRTSNGTGYYYTSGALSGGGGGVDTGVYLTGNVNIAADTTITSANATINVTGNISSSSGKDLIVDSSTFDADNISNLDVLTIKSSTATVGTLDTINTATIESDSYTGNAISSVDALEIQSNTLSVTGNIETDTSLTFNSSSNLSIANVITGTGQLIKSNTNQLTLTGTNNFTGGVSLSAGTLALNSAAAIGSSGTVVLGGGTLKYSSSNTTDYSSRFSTANDQKYNIDTNSQSISFANNLTSSGGILTKTGNGTLTLSGTNTYTGGTNISGGSILLNSAGAIGSTGTLLFNGGTLVYSANNTTDYSSRISTAASQNFNINTSGQDISYSTRLASSSGTLTKSGTGSLTLAGANTYNGLTTVSAGTLVSNGTINGDLSISSGATFDLNQTDTIGSLTGSGTIDIASAKVLTVSSSSNSTFSGTISGDGQLKKSGSGTLILSGTNTYTGGTNFSAGTLQLSSSGALGSSGDLTFSGGILKYTSSNNNDYSSRLDSSSSQNFKIDTNSQNVTWASNFVNDNSTFAKSGSGTLTLSGDFGLTDESFTATNVSISGGTLSLPNTVNSIGSINLQGGGINCPSCPSLGDFVATAGSTLTFNAAVFDSLTLASGVTVNASSITVNNTSSLGGDITTTGPMSFGGAVTLVANTNLISTNNSITFNSTINGTKELSVNAGTSTAAFNGAVGGTTKLSKLTVNATGGITINNVSIKGLNDGLYFQKFDGTWAANTVNLSNRTEQVIRSTEVSGAPGNQKGIVADRIDICSRGDCDSTYTYKVTGYFVAAQTGSHNFYILGDDTNHLYLGTAGQSLTEYETYVESVSTWNKTGWVTGLNGCCSWRNGTVNLTAGEQYPLYAVFHEGGGGDYLRVKWKNPDNQWVNLVSNRTSVGTGYYFTERDSTGSGSSDAGIYLTGDVTVASNTNFDAAKGVVNITGDISGSTSTDFTINSKSVDLDSITEFAALNIEVTNDSKVDGVISGTNVTFQKKGDGKLTLTKENTFTGSTNIIGGTILLDNGAIMGDDGEPTGVINYGSLGNVSNPLTIGSGTLTIKDRDMTFYGLTMGANSVINTSSSSSITLPSNNLAGDLTSYTLGGSITTSGTQTYSGAISLAGDLSLTSGNQAINFTQDAALTGNNNDLTINSGSGTTTFINPMSGLGTLSSTGTTIINSNEISSAGSQTYGALTFGGDLKLVTTNSNVNFNSTVSGTGKLEASVGTGTVYFKDKVGSNNIDTTLSSLIVTGKSYVAADVFTVNNQIYSSDMNVNGSINLTSLSGNITLNGDITAVGSAIMALLGNGNFLLNGESYDLTSDSAAGTLAGLSYDTSSEKYTWTAASTSAETLIVAGGGGGGMDIGGGGGGGGVIAQNVVLVKGTNYSISVGDGGSGAPTGGTGSGTQGRTGHQWTINAKQGENSTFETASGTLTAIGGGYGGTGPWNHTLQGQAGSGGSGGGASGYNASYSGRNGSGTAGQGNAGASGAGHHVAGGGGGAGGAGSTGRSHYSAVGGPGIENCILGTCYYWAGGGGGGSYNYYGGHGGIGGGGGGGTGSTTGGAGFNNGSAGGGGGLNRWANKPGGNGGANTGGGGGGGSHYNATNQGGDGGSGIVVVKYSTANSLNLTASNGTVTLDTDLKLSNLDTFKVTENTTRDFNFNSLTLVNSPFDLVNQKLTTKTLSIDSGSSITNSSGFSMVEVTGTSSIGGTITTSGKVFNKADVAVKTKAEALVDDPADAVYAESEWGQYYGDKITLTSNASLISYRDVVEENDEFGAAIHLNGVEGNYKFTVDANNGWIVSNNKIGDAPILDTDARVIALNSGRSAYYSNYDYTEKLNNSVKNVKEVDFKANEIYLRADVITDYNQTYTGHVNIGNNGTNGLERNLTSVDPTIAFYGKPVLYETEVNGQTVRLTSKEVYTFDDESLTPTHTLNLTAKGHCYVGSSITCGVPGNIRKGLDAEGENTAFYNSLSPLKEVTTDNIAMLFPDTGYFAGINVNPIIIPKGTVDGSTTSSENIPWKGAISYSRFKAPIEPKFNPNIKPSKGPPEAGSLFGNMFVLNNPGNNAYNAPAGNFGGEVIVGNVVANFGSNSFDAPSMDFGGGAFGGAFNSPVDNNFKPQNNNFNSNSTQLPKDFGPQDFGPQDFGPQDFGSKDFGPQDFGPQDFGSKDFGPQDFGPQDFGPQDFGSEDFGPQEFRTQKDFGPQENNPEGEFIPRDKSGKPMTLEELQELGIDKPKPSNPDGKDDFRDEAGKEEFKENQNDILEENQENSLETNEDSIDGFDQDDEEDESIEEENNTES